MKKVVFFATAALFFAISNPANAQNSYVIDGNMWAQLDKISKVFYLAGYIKGVYRGVMVGLRDIDCVSLENLSEISMVKFRDFAGKKSIEDLLPEIDRTYQDKRNLLIEVDHIIVFALTKLNKGMSKQKEDAWLQLLRTTGH